MSDYIRKKKCQLVPENIPFTIRTIPPAAKEFLIEEFGKKEYRRLKTAMLSNHWIIIAGEPRSGKSTIVSLIRNLGYPFVLEAGDEGFTFKTKGPIASESQDLKPIKDLYEKLGIEMKY